MQSYRAETLLNAELQTMREEILQHLKKALASSESCRTDFEPFDFLWVGLTQHQFPHSLRRVFYSNS